jgi:glycosyltransferase involved in cell wall biosynthesis
MPERIIFVPETTAFGGGERILLGLSRHLHGQKIPHRVGWYFRNVDLGSHANWPLVEDELKPVCQPILKARSLKNYLAKKQRAGSGTALLVGIQAALHVGMFNSRDYVLMILDTPSLLSPPPDAAKAASGAKQKIRDRCATALIRRGMKRARRVIATSQFMADEMAALYGVQATIARQGVDLSVKSAPSRTGAKMESFRLLSVSRLEENKRIDWIIEAVSQLQSSDGLIATKRWHLDIVGDGSSSVRLRRQAEELGLSGRVTFHGHVSDQKLEQIYSEASLFLMPARQGYGLPALEALGRGLPAVAHRESGVSELLQKTPWVELIDGRIESLTAGMKRIMHRIESGELAATLPPRFPTESDWAEQICVACDWRQPPPL